MFYSPKEMQKMLNDNEFLFKKKFGQNFIIDENIINNIIKVSDLSKDTLVIEIGPGAGSLTRKLAINAGFVLCYEIDKALKPILDNNLKDFVNVNVIYNDFLTENIVNELKKYDFNKVCVVANLPYYITTPIVTKIIDNKIPVDKMVIMVQKEVGDRFKAIPNTKDYSSLSVFLNYYFDIKKELDVSKNVFLPRPNVDSIVISLTKKEQRNICLNEDLFFKLIRDAFKQKRKTLKNNLKDYNIEKIEEVLIKYGFDLSVRAEQLGLDVYIDLANNL